MKYELKVGVSSTPAGLMVPRLLVELDRALPQVEVRFTVSDSSTVRDQVLGRRVELGMVGRHFEHEDLLCESFLEADKLVVIVPPGSPLARGRTISIGQLSRERFIGRRLGSGTRHVYEPVLAAAGAPLSSLNVVREEAGAPSCIEAVANGEGLSIVSLLSAGEAIEAGLVVALELEAVTLVRNLYVISNARAGMSEHGKGFVRFLMKWCERCHHLAPGVAEELRAAPI
jgi:DNA-binding transcriptional LysR family regulator